MLRRLFRGALGGFAYEVVQVLAEALDPAEGALGQVSCVCFGEPGDERPYSRVLRAGGPGLRVQGCYPVPFPAGRSGGAARQVLGHSGRHGLPMDTSRRRRRGRAMLGTHSASGYTQYRREHGEKAPRSTIPGQAISYRSRRDGKGWRVLASTQMMHVPVVTDQRRGVTGIDPQRRPPGRGGDRRQRQLLGRLAGTSGHLRQEH